MSSRHAMDAQETGCMRTHTHTHADSLRNAHICAGDLVGPFRGTGTELENSHGCRRFGHV